MPDYLYAIKSALKSLQEAQETLNDMQTLMAEGLEFHDVEFLEDIQALCPNVEDTLKRAEDTLQKALCGDGEMP